MYPDYNFDSQEENDTNQIYGDFNVDSQEENDTNQKKPICPDYYNSLKVEKYCAVVEAAEETNMSSETCSICTEDFLLDDAVQKLSCRHIFHENCIKTWFDVQSSCPCCRCSFPDLKVTLSDLDTEYTFGDTGYCERDVYVKKQINKLKDMFKLFCDHNNIRIKYYEYMGLRIGLEFHIGSKNL